MTTKDQYHVFTEIPPITRNDTFVVFERRKTNFNYPVHVHQECELNFIRGAKGATRIVGDSVSTIDDKEMVLMVNPGLEHAWVDGNIRKGAEIYEITIQFSPELFQGGFIDRKQFSSIRKMLEDAGHGIAFPQDAIDAVEPRIAQLTASNDSFESVLIFLSVMNSLARSGYVILSHSSFTHQSDVYDSKSVQMVMDFLNSNYRRQVKVSEAAKYMNMSEPSFCRFLKKRTGQSFINLLNNIRVGATSRLLVDEPNKTISEIAFECGFNNLANFNRIFKKLKGHTPKDFREYYKKNKIII